nr:MAG TPA: Regulatory protein-modification, helix-turn-helix, transcriptional regulato, DNA [Caudoviricetes sp.]
MNRDYINPVRSVVIGLKDKLGYDRLTIAHKLGCSRSFLNSLESGEKRVPSDSIDKFLELAAKLDDERLMKRLRKYHAEQLVVKFNPTELELLREYFKNEA